MTERGLKNINVFYSTFTDVFYFCHVFTFFNAFNFFLERFLHLWYCYGKHVLPDTLWYCI